MSLVEIFNLKMDYLKCSSLNLEIKTNDLVVFYGENGSGKSTFIRLILKFIKPHQGFVRYSNLKISYVSEFCFIPPTLKVCEYFEVLESIFKINLDRKYLDFFEIPMHKMIKSLSKGNKQKVCIIASTISNPDLFIFDEPLSGFDDINDKNFKKFIKFLLSNNKTVLISTHKPKLFKDIANKVVQIC